ncbi:MAG: hypothetical protein UX02_C0001G0119 [Candidatus Moranbacteria bacterium GW2011_GWC1_45_18]|nr:MAG: hypothetical protein UT79_C0002G0278 [Candidatus Moranbacteria bacterium GW2011_GWC2_40_12]KKT34117.1 MAG: hypothetical protein UW19_C0001G0012 [Candidatus Moranbacteria bacterium GW2011_GWF2_44_10]KKU00671.1 MAG: hypothetical protein UX02_C0001G0119 [Candidatus Moranbacteria bacterium GW2011_GWC1_45_18]OGI24536.1 MAG: hypothetical protein A2194_00245 [Candidatus Moranbacteria bacterium RIFOXYA1_FULL_44_8]OGI36090.1 MAG: hypothetical protein A2407_02090 [Candidatus Moranbacteria bacteri
MERVKSRSFAFLNEIRIKTGLNSVKKGTNKKKKMTSKKILIKRVSTPEDFFFGFLVAVSLVFVLLCFRSVAAIPVSLPQLTQSKGPNEMEKNIRKMAKGYPIEEMAPFIAGKNKKVAAFLVAIAKKESNWGVHSPKKQGKNCFNYWGYRGPENPTASGYSCFSSPRQAVNVVGKRINSLVSQKVDTPREMVMWKCGDACTRSGARGEAKWVRDVGFYYDKVL